MAAAVGARNAVSHPETVFSNPPTMKLSTPGEIVHGADEVLARFQQNNMHDPVVISFIQSVKQFAQDAQRGENSPAMVKMQATLDTICRRMETLENQPGMQKRTTPRRAAARRNSGGTTVFRNGPNGPPAAHPVRFQAATAPPRRAFPRLNSRRTGKSLSRCTTAIRGSGCGSKRREKSWNRQSGPG
jgi:hypothetical protein